MPSAAGLRERYGAFALHEETIPVAPARYEGFAAEQARDALGGGRVHLVHDGRALVVSNRDEAGWDAVGGARDPGERLAETARRECREEVGIDPDLGTVVRVNRFTFVDETDPDRRVAGCWAYFEGTTDDPTLAVQTAELDGAEWVRPGGLPADLDPYAEPLLRAWAEG